MKNLVHIEPAGAPHWVGDGFHVRSAFSYDGLGRELSPFLLLDYAAPRRFEPTEERRGVGAHPHRGFETVTIALQGEIEHRDSSGGGGVIGTGDVQWMTAAGGIVHEEFLSRAFARTGGTLEMVQLWVNLPAAHKRAPARYQALAAAQFPRVELAGGAASATVIAGELHGARGPAQTFTPVDVWTVDVARDASIELPLGEGCTAALFVLRGDVELADGRKARAGELAVFSRDGADLQFRARPGAKLLVLGGQPIDEPIAAYGPFVMNTQAEIREAIEDFQRGRMGALESM